MENDIQSEKPRNARPLKVAALVVAVLALAALMSLTERNGPNQCGCLPLGEATETNDSQVASPHGARPRLLDLGATTCIPCKMMASVLEELKSEYEGRLDVQFVDVWQTPGAANQYRVEVIPTQIFFAASGKELYRHQGFFAKDDILCKWADLGVDLTK